MRYVTAAEMKEIDRRAIEDRGIPAKVLMENAGKALYEWAVKSAAGGDSAVVFCGYGNNGGDGLVAARHLIKNGYNVSIILAGKPKSLSPETNANLEEILQMGVKPQFISKKEDIEPALKNIKKNSIIIDAIFGIGIRGDLDEFYAELISGINNIGVPVVSADIPSGMDADSGKPLPVAVKAAVTVTFGHPKSGFKKAEAKECLGKLVVADIGLPAEDAAAKKRMPERRVYLREGKKGIVRPGHPWIFKSQILSADSSANPGDIVAVTDAGGKVVGRGYYNPKSEISVRILSFSNENIDEDIFIKRIGEAFEKRKNILKVTNAYRAVFSEGDFLPGLIVDIYDDTAVFQVLTLGMEKMKVWAVGAINKILKPKYIYEKSSSSFRKLEGLKDMNMWWGEKGKDCIEISEGPAKFLVDIINGHKTGFYLDQRKSRMALEGLCKDREVLDLFSYTGGFSVSAAVYGARHVTGVDIKDAWLELARENARISGVAEMTEFIKGDAFFVLKDMLDSDRKFDVIIIDPPSFLKTSQSLASASKGYRELNTLAMRILKDKGILATFSCSYNMPNEVFSDILKKSAEDAEKKTAILKRCHQAEDHPIVRAIPETEYLKGYFLKVENK